MAEAEAGAAGAGAGDAAPSPALSLFMSHVHHALSVSRPAPGDMPMLRRRVEWLLDLYEAQLLDGRKDDAAPPEKEKLEEPERPMTGLEARLERRKVALQRCKEMSCVGISLSGLAKRVGKRKRTPRFAQAAAAGTSSSSNPSSSGPTPPPTAKVRRVVPPSPDSPRSDSSGSSGRSFVRLPSVFSRGERRGEQTQPSAPSSSPFPASLPDDMLCEVFTYLGARDHFALERSCRRLLHAGRFRTSWPRRLSIAAECGGRLPADVHGAAAALFRRTAGHLEALDLSDCFMDDACAVALASMPRLRELVVEGGLGEGAFAALGRLTELRALSVFTDRIGPGQVRALRPLARLADARFRGAPMGRDTLEELAGLPPPETLGVWLDAAAGAADGLRAVGATGRVRHALVAANVGSEAAAGALVHAIASFGPGLRRASVALDGPAAPAAAWAAAAEALPGAETLCVRRSPLPTAAHVRALGRLPALRSLTLAVPAGAAPDWWDALTALASAGRVRDLTVVVGAAPARAAVAALVARATGLARLAVLGVSAADAEALAAAPRPPLLGTVEFAPPSPLPPPSPDSP